MCGELYCVKCDLHYSDCECPGLLEIFEEKQPDESNKEEERDG